MTVPSYPASPAAPPRPPLALYRPARLLQGFAIGAACLVTVDVVVSAVVVYPAVDELAADGESLAPAVVAYYDTFLVYVLAMLVAYVLTCAWLHLARRNAEVLNPSYRHRHSVGWVWGSWVVPVVSLWFPYQVVADIRAATSSPGRTVPWRLRTWWATWLLLTIASNLTSTVVPATDVSDGTAASWEPPIQSLAALFSVVALVAWIGIVREISRGQTAEATAQGWRPALTLGAPATSVGAAPVYPGMADSGPPVVIPPAPEDAPAAAAADGPAVPSAASQYLEPSSPYLEPPAPYAVPPPPYPGSPYPSYPLPGAEQAYAGGPDPSMGGGTVGSSAWWDRPGSSAMGIWALVLAILPLCITWLVSIGLAVAVLLRPDDGWRRGRGPAIAALVISSAWVLVVSGLFVLGSSLPAPNTGPVATGKNDSDPQPAPEKTLPEDMRSGPLKVGDCLPKVPRAVDYTVHLKEAPCSDPHRAEVYSVWDLGRGHYPSVNRLVDRSDEGCLERFQSFVGDAYDWSNLEFTYLMPDEEDWHNHWRKVTCVVYAKAPLTGTLRNSRK